MKVVCDKGENESCMYKVRVSLECHVLTTLV